MEEQYDEREAKIGLKDGMGKTVWWLVGVFWDQLNGPNKRTFIKLELNRKTSATGLEMVEKQTVVKTYKCRPLIRTKGESPKNADCF